MKVAHHPHPSARRWASFIALALMAVVAASLLVVVDGAIVVPGGVAEAAPARASDDSTTVVIDVGQLFYNEKMTAPASELPAQF